MDLLVWKTKQVQRGLTLEMRHRHALFASFTAKDNAVAQGSALVLPLVPELSWFRES